ncbi:hypothetical protein L2E82_44870 [Cichorium intybus]|uniref:Uncharacterized protein n=1 Tax=Cichorium intybus TaxID=13427 RepID=A0ACB8ZRB3_CICIN|nr:hypothetical protein L2E82_44870 [Cichorium intybus]
MAEIPVQLQRKLDLLLMLTGHLTAENKEGNIKEQFQNVVRCMLLTLGLLLAKHRRGTMTIGDSRAAVRSGTGPPLLVKN